ncbi:MAG: RAMP superfamily CRISPR-associated protein [Cyanobacteria bacterium P01_A01_bin.84]
MIDLSNLTTNSIETFNLKAIVETGMCIGAGGSSGSLADKPVVRAANGKLLIPASQIKGRLRHECEKLARGLGWAICQSPAAENMCPQRKESKQDFTKNNHPEHKFHCLICQIFGNPALPSRIIFDDLLCEESPKNLKEVIRPGVTINRRRRIAEAEKLYYLETTPTNAEELKFSGQIHFLPDCPDYTKALILAALKHIQALGGSKSAGLGWLRWEIDKDLKVKEETWSKLVAGS